MQVILVSIVISFVLQILIISVGAYCSESTFTIRTFLQKIKKHVHWLFFIPIIGMILIIIVFCIEVSKRIGEIRIK